jgi:dipeptidyl aminopeptidase/acylaminoacyl peptidase
MTKAGLTRIAISAAVVLFAIAGIALAGRYLRARERMQALETLSLRAGCDKKQEVKLHLVPLQSMGIKTPVYGIDNTGALFRLNLPEANRTIISRHAFYPNRHEFDFGVAVKQSSDGRWISYSHELGDSNVLQYWLYDTRQKTDRMAFQAEAGLSGEASFSPDGSMLATALGAEAGVRKTDAGVYLIDTATLNRTRIPLPTKHPLNEVIFAPRWSADGKELLIELEVDKAKHEKNEYYSWHLADKRAEKIDGDGSNYDNLRFLRQGAAISLAADLEPQSENWATESASASGNWHAKLRQPDEQGKLSLEIKGKAGATETAFSVFSVHRLA